MSMPWLVQACRSFGRLARTVAVIGIAGLLVAFGPDDESGKLAAAKIIATPAMPMPGYLQPAIDPTFGTRFTRVTDPGHELMPGVACGAAYCTHRYSSAQAWNADQSLLAITMGCSGFCFLDGHSYAPAFYRPGSNECEWHPSDPALMLCVSPSEIYAWAPRTDAKVTLYAPAGYTGMQFGPYKGNPSNDGKTLVVRAVNAAGTLVAFAYDIARKIKHPDIDHDEIARDQYGLVENLVAVARFQGQGRRRDRALDLARDPGMHLPGERDRPIGGDADGRAPDVKLTAATLDHRIGDQDHRDGQDRTQGPPNRSFDHS